MNVTQLKWTLDTISNSTEKTMPLAGIREKIEDIQKLPALPGMASRIIAIAANPLSGVANLASAIELDPLITAQLIRWARSPLYGYAGKINDVNDAIARVIGFEAAMSLALGLSSLKAIPAPIEGPIGIRSFWIQALASSQLMKKLAAQMPAEIRPDPLNIFLAGLLHNIGFLLLGNQCLDEFMRLSHIINANTTTDILSLEKMTIEVDHAQLGTWLMTTWRMPKPIIDITYNHHNPHYRGNNFHLNLLTYLSDYLIGTASIGDAQNHICPDEVFFELGLTADIKNKLTNDLEDDLANITETVDLLLA